MVGLEGVWRLDQRIDIVMTAVLRPAIVDLVLKSIVDRICKEYIDQFRLIINIDPVGEVGATQYDVLDAANKYFSHVKARMPEEPSFPLALKWCWEQADTQYVLHTEDDFEFAKGININHLIEIMDRYPKLAMLRFDRGRTWEDPVDDMGGPTIQRGAYKWRHNPDGFYLSPNWRGAFSTSPSLLRHDFMQGITPFLRDGVSPERITMFARWLHEYLGKSGKMELRKHLQRWQSGFYAVPLVLRDHGRPWREKHSFEKPKGNRGIKRTWVKSDSTK